MFMQKNEIKVRSVNKSPLNGDTIHDPLPASTFLVDGSSFWQDGKEALDKFTEAYTQFTSTGKGLLAGVRVDYDKQQANTTELAAMKEFLNHIRTNTNKINKAMENAQWEIRELRCGVSSKICYPPKNN